MKYIAVSLMLSGVGLIGGCTQNTAQRVASEATDAGQLFCAVASPTGDIVVALADASGVPVVVTNMAESWVKAACASVGGVPVSPPANAASIPVKSANVPPSVPATAGK
jgi:hypothetical protein